MSSCIEFDLNNVCMANLGVIMSGLLTLMTGPTSAGLLSTGGK